MSLYASYDMAWCERCRGSRPHSKKGNCLATHRTSGVKSTAKPAAEEHHYGHDQMGVGSVRHKGKQSECPAPECIDRRPTRRKFDQVKVRAAVAALLAGEVTLQQAARDVGCDTEYLHGRAWKAAKDATSKRDDGRCQHPDHTGDTWVTDTHHRIGKGSGGASNPLVAFYLPNLITLCRTHHRWVTDHPLEATTLGLVIPRGIVTDPSHVPAQTIHGLTFYTADGGRRIVPDKEPA